MPVLFCSVLTLDGHDRLAHYILKQIFKGWLEEFSLFNTLPEGKILDRSKLKGYADDKVNVTQKFYFFSGEG